MAKRETHPKRKTGIAKPGSSPTPASSAGQPGRGGTVREGVKTRVTRAYVHTLRGKFKGKGLLKALMAEKKKASEL